MSRDLGLDLEKSGRCPDCGHSNAHLIRFCDACGSALYKVNRARAALLVEGTAGVGKTTLANHLLHSQVQPGVRAGTVLHLGQAHTYHPLRPDDADSAIAPADRLALLERVYQTLAFLFHPGPRPADRTSAPPFTCLIETLHLTLAARPDLLSKEQFQSYDLKLAELGCKLVLIHVSGEDLWRRCIWERRHNGFITHYGRRYGDALKDIHRHYLDEQQRMRDLFERSAMPKLLLDGGRSPEEIAERSRRFWLET